MAQFLSSDSIKVFPSGFRGQNVDVSSNLTTEENLTNISSKVTNSKRCYWYDDPSDSTKMCIVIDGYFFHNILKSSVQALFSSPSDGDIIYAMINTLALGTNNLNTLICFDGDTPGHILDVGTLFKGLAFDTSYGSVPEYHYLPLFKRVSSAWEPIISSTLNISASQVEDVEGNSLRESLHTGTLTTTTSIVNNGTTSLGGNVSLGGNITSAVNVTNATTSTSTSTGALIVAGGVGIGEKLNVAGNTTIGGTLGVANNTSIAGTFTVGTKSSNEKKTQLNGAVEINNQEVGFKISGGKTTSKNLDVQAATTIKDTTTINEALTIGDGTYTGSVTIRGLKNLILQGSGSSAQTITFGGTSNFQAGNYSSISTVGSESITIGGNTFNIVTRNSAQTIEGAKTFSGTLKLSGLTGSRALSLDANKNIVASNLSASGTSASDNITFVTGISQSSIGAVTYNYATVRSASASQSGVVTTGTQTFVGQKTFGSSSSVTGNIIMDYSTITWRRGTSSSTYSINSYGNCVMQNYNATSDRRLKENIKEYHCEKSILDLPIVEFDFKDSKEHHIGCIAQDLQKICPEIVHENEDGYLSIEENKLVYLLMEEVKQLKEEIKKLKKEN